MVSGQKEQTEIDNLHEQVRLLKDEYCTIYDDYKNELDSSKTIEKNMIGYTMFWKTMKRKGFVFMIQIKMFSLVTVSCVFINY